MKYMKFVAFCLHRIVGFTKSILCHFDFSSFFCIRPVSNINEPSSRGSWPSWPWRPKVVRHQQLWPSRRQLSRAPIAPPRQSQHPTPCKACNMQSMLMHSSVDPYCRHSILVKIGPKTESSFQSGFDPSSKSSKLVCLLRRQSCKNMPGCVDTWIVLQSLAVDECVWCLLGGLPVQRRQYPHFASFCLKARLCCLGLRFQSAGHVLSACSYNKQDLKRTFVLLLLLFVLVVVIGRIRVRGFNRIHY